MLYSLYYGLLVSSYSLRHLSKVSQFGLLLDYLSIDSFFP